MDIVLLPPPDTYGDMDAAAPWPWAAMSPAGRTLRQIRLLPYQKKARGPEHRLT